jgi:methyl-accepting chemotaxis protein
MSIWIVRVLAFFALFPLASSALAAEPQLKLDPAIALNSYMALVEQSLEDTSSELRILAASENARSADWERIKGPLAILAKGMPMSAAVWFARPDGSYFTVAGGLTKQNIRNRSYFPALLAGKEVEGALVISKSTGKRSAIIAVPVQKAGRVIGALGVSIAMEKVADMVDAKTDFPKQVMFYALDERGEIVLHRQSTLLFEFARKLGSPSLTKAVDVMLTKPEGVVHYAFQGAQRTAFYKRSKVTGWIFALRW